MSILLIVWYKEGKVEEKEFDPYNTEQVKEKLIETIQNARIIMEWDIQPLDRNGEPNVMTVRFFR